MKRAIIVHCWGGNSKYAWYPSVQKELETLGYQVFVPDMPGTDAPKLSEWLPFLSNLIDTPDEDLVLIGHSVGTVVIMRYLESLKEKEIIGKAILVAGYTDPLGFKELENFFKTNLDFEKIKTKSKKGFVLIQSDNDPFVSDQYGIRLRDELNAKLVVKHNALHMSGSADGENACLELPEVTTNL